MSTANNEIDVKLHADRKILDDTLMQYSSVNAEYLVQLPRKANDDHRKAIYKILMTFAFPMNTNPINRKYIEDSLTIEEIEYLNNFEMQFLQEKINEEVLKEVTLIPIPKTIYQLFFVVHAFSQASALPKFECPDDDLTRSIKYNPARKLNYEVLLQKLEDKQYVNAWWQVNDALIKEWSRASSCEAFIDAQVDWLISLTTAKPCAIPKPYLTAATPGRQLQVFVKGYSDEALQRARAFLKRIALEECLEPKDYLLYCQTYHKPFNGPVMPAADNETALVYFCDGLLTNFLHEPSECPLIKLMQNKKNKLYMYSLDKNRYLSNDLSNKPFFFLPPFPRMLNLLLSNWAYDFDFLCNGEELKTSQEERLQEKEGISSICEELQRTQDYFKHLQNVSSSIGLPSAVAGIIFQYSIDSGIGNLLVRNEVRKGAKADKIVKI